VVNRADPTYGMGEHTIADAALGTGVSVGVQIKTRLLALFRAPDYKPPLLPAVALELMALARKPRVEVSAIVRLLGSDPLLAAQLLRLAESPVYARGEPVRSLNDAVVRLGLTRTADLFVRAALETRLLKAPGYDSLMGDLRRHSAFTAEVARLVSRYALGFDDYAFLCGLLHDMGVAAALIAVSELKNAPERPAANELWPVLCDLHAGSSEMLANVWGLPREMALILGLHHGLEQGGHVHPLAAAVSLADHLAEEAGFGLFGECDVAETARVATKAGLDARTLDELRAAVTKLAAQFQS
jgi:HD-like signal output (HDOD) protein